MKLDISFQNIHSLTQVYIPDYVTELDCSWNHLTTLRGCPSNIIKIDCESNNITSFDGCPPNVIQINCQDNMLTSLRGCPDSVKILDCSWNDIESMKFCPANISKISFFGDAIKSLEYCPNKAESCTFLSNNTKLHWQHNEILAVKIIQNLYKNRCAKIIQRWWVKRWMTPNKNGVSLYCARVCDDLQIYVL